LKYHISFPVTLVLLSSAPALSIVWVSFTYCSESVSKEMCYLLNPYLQRAHEEICSQNLCGMVKERTERVKSKPVHCPDYIFPNCAQSLLEGYNSNGYPPILPGLSSHAAR
uniref:Uncharacterized protein n=1 Tax=Zosterops lateralis melanops TaxID=1220523 RepID=A0A8D2Q0G7_ZOSLA